MLLGYVKSHEILFQGLSFANIFIVRHTFFVTLLQSVNIIQVLKFHTAQPHAKVFAFDQKPYFARRTMLLFAN